MSIIVLSFSGVKRDGRASLLEIFQVSHFERLLWGEEETEDLVFSFLVQAISFLKLLRVEKEGGENLSSLQFSILFSFGSSSGVKKRQERYKSLFSFSVSFAAWDEKGRR
ncbi:hypothetical protein AVEN_242719-1 [Araneus ventricosus]|uniref:Uncharacterized protein n=1 Tax=Araneus ventricosus TaxID=182803 RepID=A0A4Y2SXV5_ARAVE|nr:hypothetical protein AVEN_242719-1 [Araneus ventricosus]